MRPAHLEAEEPGQIRGRAREEAGGLGQLGHRPRKYLTEYWDQTVRAVGAKTVIGIHWDDFFRPLSQPLRALPFAADDLDFSMRMLGELADRDGVALLLPTVWRPEDPWI